MKQHPNDWLLPEFPRIPHLIQPPNMVSGELVAHAKLVDYVLNSELIVEEKLDGANCGMAFDENGINLIRNRKHILSKNYSQEHRTPAKEQFLPAWGWLMDNKHRFELINKIEKDLISIYGEWVLAIHGVKYDRLPSRFIPYAIYSSGRRVFLPVEKTRSLLEMGGFPLVRRIYEGRAKLEDLEDMANDLSLYSTTEKREGIVIKIKGTNEQYKLIRYNYTQNTLWDDKEMHKQANWEK